MAENLPVRHKVLGNMGDTNKDEMFADLLAAQQGRLLAFIYALVHNIGDAEDLYQETAIALWRKFGEYEPGTSFGAWAKEMARFEALHFLRRKRRDRVVFDEQLLATLAGTQARLDVAEKCDTPESYHHALLDCMDRLDAIDRRLINLCYSRKSSLRSVAEKEGRSPPSVCNSLRRIRGILFDCITQSVTVDKDDK
jgi:RNA polymerase sigma-70 factor, ECF subfamily